MFEYNVLNSNDMVLTKIPNDYSGFSLLGDLSKYSCETLMNTIKDMEVEVSYEDVYQYVTWENKQIAVTICFNLSGEFIRIEREVWKDLGYDNSYSE
jgi:hypothetical protein